jgi:hypothetical protein
MNAATFIRSFYIEEVRQARYSNPCNSTLIYNIETPSLASVYPVQDKADDPLHFLFQGQTG